MKRIVTVAIAFSLAVSFIGADSAEAGRRNRSARQARVFQRNNNGPSMFEKVMDLERRKNAWLRATFLGR
ncbi:MAG: hypothetical protein ABJZ55_25300 [Fuerstiella sp.]